MALVLYGFRRNLVGQGCACGNPFGGCFWSKGPRPKNSNDRTVSYRKRSGTRRNKRIAQSSVESAWNIRQRRGI